MDTILAPEKQRAQSLAKEYRSQGYEVIEEPSQEQLPSFLAGYHPDLLIRKPDETVVVEVKSRASLPAEPQIKELVRLLRAQPGWSFELVVLDTKEQLDVPAGARPFGRPDILLYIAEIERVLEFGFAKAALVLAWSIAEATVRLLAEQEGLRLDHYASHYIIKQAMMNGIISREDYRFLLKALQYRNAYAHGYEPCDFEPTLLNALIDTTKRLVQSITPSTSV